MLHSPVYVTYGWLQACFGLLARESETLQLHHDVVCSGGDIMPRASDIGRACSDVALDSEKGWTVGMGHRLRHLQRRPASSSQDQGQSARRPNRAILGFGATPNMAQLLLRRW